MASDVETGSLIFRRTFKGAQELAVCSAQSSEDEAVQQPLDGLQKAFAKLVEYNGEHNGCMGLYLQNTQRVVESRWVHFALLNLSS